MLPAVAIGQPSLLWLCVLLFVDGATFAFATTALLLYYARGSQAWQVALAGGAASALGSGAQLWILRWLLGGSRPWMYRLAPARERVEAALRRHPSASFVSLVVVRATPVPDAPLKLVAAAGRYPIPLYMLAVFLGALPYYYALALLGRAFRFPGWLIVAAIIGCAAALAAELVMQRRRSRRELARGPGGEAGS